MKKLKYWIRLPIAAFLLISGISLAAEEPESYPQFYGGADVVFTLKVENTGDTYSLFDELGVHAGLNISSASRAFLYLEIPELMGENAGWTDGLDGFIRGDDRFPRTLAYVESRVLEQVGYEPSVSPAIYLGYGSRQQALVAEFTRYRFERSGTSGIDGFDLAASIHFGKGMSLTTAFNPASLGSGGSDPDVYVAFGLVNDHRGSSWGKQIHFISSSMQLFYDSSANFDANPIYDPSVTESAMILGIGGTLDMTFAGIGIYGFGMTEFFLKYDQNNENILQAEWGAGFLFPVLSEFIVNLSGHNAVIFTNSGSSITMNFGLDMQLMFNDFFGWFGAVAGVGILDDTGASVESGLCLRLGFFEIFAGYSNHAIGTSAKYSAGAFDRTTVDGTNPLGGGFFLTTELRL